MLSVGLHFGMEDRAIISQCIYIFLHRASNCNSKHTDSNSSPNWMIRDLKSTDYCICYEAHDVIQLREIKRKTS